MVTVRETVIYVIVAEIDFNFQWMRTINKLHYMLQGIFRVDFNYFSYNLQLAIGLSFEQLIQVKLIQYLMVAWIHEWMIKSNEW